MHTDRTVRSEPKAPSWIRAGFAIAEQFSAALSGRWAQQIFFTPQKRPPRPFERACLERALRFNVETKHGRIAAYAWGDSGDTVFLAHGWSGHAGQFSALISALGAAGLRAVAIDMPAHGASEGERSSTVHFADAIGALRQVIGAPHAIVAHSMGAAATTLALARGQVSAERVVFVSAPAQFEPYWARFRQGLGLSRDGWNAMQAASEAWLGLPFAQVVPLAHAARMTVPLLAFHDIADREVPVSEGRELVAAWPGAELVESEGLGHNRILADAATIARVTDFLRA